MPKEADPDMNESLPIKDSSTVDSSENVIDTAAVISTPN